MSYFRLKDLSENNLLKSVLENSSKVGGEELIPQHCPRLYQHTVTSTVLLIGGHIKDHADYFELNRDELPFIFFEELPAWSKAAVIGLNSRPRAILVACVSACNNNVGEIYRLGYSHVLESSIVGDGCMVYEEGEERETYRNKEKKMDRQIKI